MLGNMQRQTGLIPHLPDLLVLKDYSRSIDIQNVQKYTSPFQLESFLQLCKHYHYMYTYHVAGKFPGGKILRLRYALLLRKYLVGLDFADACAHVVAPIC